MRDRVRDCSEQDRRPCERPYLSLAPVSITVDENRKGLRAVYLGLRPVPLICAMLRSSSTLLQCMLVTGLAAMLASPWIYTRYSTQPITMLEGDWSEHGHRGEGSQSPFRAVILPRSIPPRCLSSRALGSLFCETSTDKTRRRKTDTTRRHDDSKRIPELES